MLLAPLKTLDEWKARLASPDAQWKDGYSAKALARRWVDADGFPPEVAGLLASNEGTRGAQPLIAIPEHAVPLRGGGRASQTDLWVLARTARGLLSIAVEGKVSESFGPTVGEWRTNASSGKTERWRYVCRLLDIEADCRPTIRYQLFHRTVSALVEAERFCARAAAVVVHSFSPTVESFGDFQQFVAMLGARLEGPGRMVDVAPRQGIDLYFGWAQS